MNLIFGHDQAVAEWVIRRIPYMDVVGPCTAIGVAENGNPIAGVIYHQHDVRFQTMMVSMAADSPRWARRGVVLALLHYPFEQIGIRKLWSVMAFSNKRAIKFNKGLGFRQEAILSRHFGDDHAMVTAMFRKEYFELKERMMGHGEVGRTSASAA